MMDQGARFGRKQTGGAWLGCLTTERDQRSTPGNNDYVLVLALVTSDPSKISHRTLTGITTQYPPVTQYHPKINLGEFLPT
ncbi:hypothetical protein CC1G_15728 [Coprinopsis cinerea okayama7|uniref:Uncharacterized protein n=1 Tax=Coprinopsis cinerea (strain Okayama-7 / 130 / ATCC MYA-4618 / FGSC 9003) TaxID=240176 RepID=D6RQ87_COPC7|nr:hypothetical protein CC1G_15728 [Coprinopsis cinerea okayama7\|eukprot:XP_002910299.1 hypothetical protein CC1G_15728 [Coprinopsis cinerea okayama7\